MSKIQSTQLTFAWEGLDEIFMRDRPSIGNIWNEVFEEEFNEPKLIGIAGKKVKQ